MGKVKTRGKLGYPSKNLTFQDGGQLPPDLNNLDYTWGISNWKSHHGKIALTLATVVQCKKPIYQCITHARQCMAISATLLPSQIFVLGPIYFRFGHLTRTDPKGNP